MNRRTIRSAQRSYTALQFCKTTGNAVWFRGQTFEVSPPRAPSGRWRSVGKDWRGADIGSVEAETVIAFLQRFQQKCDLLRRAGRIKTYQPNRRPRAKDCDHDRFVIDRVPGAGSDFVSTSHQSG